MCKMCDLYYGVKYVRLARCEICKTCEILNLVQLAPAAASDPCTKRLGWFVG